MKARLQLLWLDSKRSWLIILISAAVVYGLTGYVINGDDRNKVWRMGYLALEVFVPLFLLWPMTLLQRFFASDETETLRTAGNKYSCAPSIALLFLLEGLLLVPSYFWGMKHGLDFRWILCRAWIFMILIAAVYYFLTVLIKNGTVPLAIGLAYCMFCTFYGGQSALKKYCIYYPASSEPVTGETVLSLLWYVGLSLILMVSAYILERKRAWME